MYILSRLSPLMLCLNSSGFLRRKRLVLHCSFICVLMLLCKPLFRIRNVGHGHVFIATTLIASVPVAYPC
jgi:hypothetical protein